MILRRAEKTARDFSTPGNHWVGNPALKVVNGNRSYLTKLQYITPISIAFESLTGSLILGFLALWVLRLAYIK